VTWRGLLRVGLVALLVAAVFVVLLLRPAAHNPPAQGQAGLPSLGAGPQPAFAPGRPELLRHAAGASRWATVPSPVTALRTPGGTRVATLAASTPEGTTNLVLVLGSVRRRGVEWVHVRLPVLPNGTTGWVRRSALGGYHFVTTHLVVDLGRLRATLWRGGRVVFSAPVGVGQPQYPTPRGQFYIRDELTGYASSFYGPVAFGTSARSAVLTEWPDGGFVGIHGTDEPGLIPGRVSHGCIRMRNQDILRLARLMTAGTPLTIR
jgi:L,D-transpeptidase catalytic domain